MSVVVFAGPTIPIDVARCILVDAIYLPPVRQGDVFRICRASPKAIGIIDGYFDRVPSVWHKEILHALRTGIHVFGGASMGALRAVELEPFGMVGVGAVFEAFRSGEIEDDDEVAIVHAPAADHYRALSEAAVNVRATLAAAVSAGIISVYGAQGLMAAAKALPYEQRSYPAILEAAVTRVPATELTRFASWWPRGRIDQKRRDATELLETMKAFLETDPKPKQVNFEVEQTDAWLEACDPLRRAPPLLDEGPVGDSSVLEELQVSGAYPETAARAFTRALALAHKQANDGPASHAELDDTLLRFFAERGMAQGPEVKRWKAMQGLTQDDEFRAFMERQADVYRAELNLERETLECIADELRVVGSFARLKARAMKKRETLRQTFTWEPELSDTNLSEDGLWDWYFRDVLRSQRPTSLASAARSFGFEDLPSFRTAVVRERLFQAGLREADVDADDSTSLERSSP